MKNTYLIGNSIDIHKIKEMNCKIKLGGVSFDSNWQIIANSDGDIILHALAEGIYGALGLGDLGEHFPEENSTNEKINSSLILNDALHQMQKKGFKIGNIDITAISEHIFFKNYKIFITKNLVRLTNCKRINLKATRWEEDRMFVQVHCSVLLTKENYE